jgi:imidazolonepropionase
MVQADRYLLCAARVVTCCDRLDFSNNPLSVIEDGAVLVDCGRIAEVGPRAHIVSAAPDLPILCDAVDGVLTPGLIDAHTHLAWCGSRHDEYVLRMQGAGYEAIAARGGGIVASMQSIRSASREQIEECLRVRLRRIASLGVTTCEVKSGYGLSLESERKQLEAIAATSTDPSLPDVVSTFLALHAVPPEGKQDRAGWIEHVVANALPTIAREGLAQFVDAYIDRNAFAIEEARLLFEAARHLHLGIRAHVGQFADIGGASLAASMGAVCVDHVEHISEAALAELAAAGTCVVLLPMACFTLKQDPPPIDSMRKAGVRLVVASDANPGTAPTESLPLSLAFALHTYRLSPEECILGATRHAAVSLGRDKEIGSISKGKSADLVVWDLPHEHAILQPWGSPMTRIVVRKGRVLHEAQHEAQREAVRNTHHKTRP